MSTGISLPRHLPLWQTITVVVGVVGLLLALGWRALAIETRVNEHETVLTRVVAYMCMDCVDRKGSDACRFICGLE